MKSEKTINQLVAPLFAERRLKKAIEEVVIWFNQMLGDEQEKTYLDLYEIRKNYQPASGSSFCRTEIEKRHWRRPFFLSIGTLMADKAYSAFPLASKYDLKGLKIPIGWFSSRTGTSVDDGKTRGKD